LQAIARGLGIEPGDLIVSSEENFEGIRALGLVLACKEDAQEPGTREYEEHFSMSTSTCEAILEGLRLLTPEERSRMQLEIARPTGGTADFLAFLRTAEPLPAETLDALERAVADEHFNSDTHDE
jgi:hypothetical protein